MTDLKQPPKVYDQSRVQESWKAQISEGLRWLNDRAWPLTGCALFIAVVYLYNFIQMEKVPLSITSPAIITALPALMGLVVFIASLLAGALFSPTMMLFVSIKKGHAERLADLLLRKQDKRQENERRAIWIILRGWLGVIAWFAAVLGLLTWSIPERWFSEGNPWLSVIVPVALVIAVLLFYFLVRRNWLKSGDGNEQAGLLRMKDVSWDFWGMTFTGSVIQLLLMSLVASLSSRRAQGAEHELSAFITYWALGSIALGFVQLVGAKYLATLMRVGISFRKGAAIAAAVVLLLGFIPATGGALVGVAFQFTASGGRPCVVLSWAGDVEVKAFKRLQDPYQLERSLPLRILLEADGIYRIRLRDEPAGKVFS